MLLGRRTKGRITFDMYCPTLPVLLSVLSLLACGDGGDSELRFSKADCEAEWSTSALVVFGLDDRDLRVERATVVRETGMFSTSEEAVASLTFGGPVGLFKRVFTAGSLELWEAPAIDFGAMAWVDTTTSEVVISGAVIWAGGSDASPKEDTTLLIGAPPAIKPTVVFAPNSHWRDEEVTSAVADFGLRTEVVARYTACENVSVIVYVYTPVVGGVDARAARGVILVSGHRSGGRPLSR